MPFHISSDSAINSNPIHPFSSATTSAEMRLWEQAKRFFDPIQRSDAQECIRTMCHPPASITREAVVNQFEQLRMLAYPGYKDNIQFARHGENHFCILSENGQEILSVTLADSGTYQVEYEGRKIRHPFAAAQQQAESEAENTAGASIITPALTAEQCEAIWSSWEPSEEEYRYIEEKSNIEYQSDESNSSVSHTSSFIQQLSERIDTISSLRNCLKNNDTKLTLSYLHTLFDLPEALPPSITELKLDNISVLQKLPPLPPGLQKLSLSRIPLERLPVLPPELKALDIEELNLTELSGLPPGLKTLSICDMPGLTLRTLPSRLTTLIADNININSISEWPPTLKTLIIIQMNEVRLSTLPNGLTYLGARNLHTINLSDLPSSLKNLDIRNIFQVQLPTLPNQLTYLIAHNVGIPRLPELPLGLQSLFIYRIPLAHFPPLPLTLRHLVVNNIPLISGLEDIVNLPSTTRISLGGTMLSNRLFQTLHHLTRDPNYSGPQIHFNMTDPSYPQEIRALNAAVADWLTLTEEETAASSAIWTSFEQENHSASFSHFLDRLSDTKNFRKNSAFKAQISSWLTLLAEDAELRAKTFTMATDATSSCEDRVTLAMNQMKRVQLVHQVEKGLFDKRTSELVAVGREMFRLEKLEVIAREKTKTLKLVDEIEVWLGYQNQLKEPLGLTSVTAEMRFFDVSGISQSDLQVAEAQVKSAENSQFPTWILQWAPLHSLLQRTDSAGWQALTEKRGTDYEIHYQTLSDTELKPANLIGNTEAERTIGTRAMANAEKSFLEGLRILTDQKLAEHLRSIWP